MLQANGRRFSPTSDMLVHVVLEHSILQGTRNGVFHWLIWYFASFIFVLLYCAWGDERNWQH